MSKVISLVFVLIVVLAVDGQSKNKGFLDKNLGGGFYLAHRSADLSRCKDCFEATAHYKDLYLRNNRIIDTVGECNVAPKGRFVICERDGKLLLYDKKTQRLTDVTDGQFAIPKSIAWNERLGIAKIEYYEEHAPSTVRIISTNK